MESSPARRQSSGEPFPIRKPVDRLAESAELQRNWLARNGFHIDELALDFGGFYGVDRSEIERDYPIAAAALSAIDLLFGAFSGTKPFSVWHPDRLSSEEWNAIRSLAKLAQRAFDRSDATTGDAQGTTEADRTGSGT